MFANILKLEFAGLSYSVLFQILALSAGMYIYFYVQS